MRPKFTWKICLIIGISSFALLINNSCRDDDALISYVLKVKWIYINETGYNISYLPEDFWSKFNVGAYDTTVYIQVSEGPKDVKVENIVPPINALAVVDKGIKIDTIPVGSLSLREITSYEYKKIGRNNFEFTFRFTSENLSTVTGK